MEPREKLKKETTAQKEGGAVLSFSLSLGYGMRKEYQMNRGTVKVSDSRGLQGETYQWNRAVDAVCHKAS